ncbi:MAG: histidinol-phosphatase [Deltaproteobacteria bacterium]|nr:histidinol-phosphatase [Deltaproteobacteria bacterium]
MPRLDLAQALRCAEAAADAARREILPRFRNVAVETKRDGSPVTEADRAAERAIREVLASFDRELPILGEEYGGETGQRGWIVDPIDGTISFSRGLPLYGTLIALVDEGAPVLGLIDLPSLGERTSGHRGGGVRRNGASVRCSQETELARALVSHGDPFAFELFGMKRGWTRLAESTRMLRGYTDAFGHALVIGGGVGAMVDVNLNPWDAAATQALVPEAGGRCETLAPGPGGKGIGLVFGSPALVERLLELLRA